MSFLVGGVVCRHPARATRDQTRYASPHIPRGLDRLTRSLVAQQVKKRKAPARTRATAGAYLRVLSRGLHGG